MDTSAANLTEFFWLLRNSGESLAQVWAPLPPHQHHHRGYVSSSDSDKSHNHRQAVEFLRKGPSVIVCFIFFLPLIEYPTSSAIRMSSAEAPVILPGDTIDPSHIPSHPKKALQLGPGLRHIPPSTILPTVAGQLVTDRRKNSLWVEYNGGRVSIQSAISFFFVFLVADRRWPVVCALTR